MAEKPPKDQSPANYWGTGRSLRKRKQLDSGDLTRMFVKVAKRIHTGGQPFKYERAVFRGWSMPITVTKPKQGQTPEMDHSVIAWHHLLSADGISDPGDIGAE